ncbi:hypothetical protein AK812_SmicGene46874 [Symbiodinium microadriaticum]|uniref:Uncharacterized protein n=1 Tax=Symbiodinium microadriaticum TaxID=2951 RepID=A0A1Q9BSV0_SYMMI|nr:hypothetical protein AK812_SmicGene46874 [Symbiodinium microadriaticum]
MVWTMGIREKIRCHNRFAILSEPDEDQDEMSVSNDTFFDWDELEKTWSAMNVLQEEVLAWWHIEDPDGPSGYRAWPKQPEAANYRYRQYGNSDGKAKGTTTTTTMGQSLELAVVAPTGPQAVSEASEG